MPAIEFQYPDGSPATVSSSTNVSMHAYMPHPGEHVVLRDDDRPFRDEIDADLKHSLRRPLAGRPLAVARAIVVIEQEHSFSMLEFEGVQGRFAASAFVDAREVKVFYGVVGTLGDDIWLVPMSERVDGTRDVSNGALRVATLERAARHQLMDMYSPSEDAAAAASVYDVFKDQVRDPITGEFHVVILEDGSASIAGAPWTSGCNEQDIKSLHEAVDEAMMSVTLKRG